MGIQINGVCTHGKVTLKGFLSDNLNFLAVIFSVVYAVVIPPIKRVCTHGKVILKENFLPKKCLRTLAVIFEHLLIQLPNVIIPPYD